MNFVNGIAAVAALSIASTAFAQSPRADERQVIALADTGSVRIAPADVSLESYAGMYASNDGEAFVITRDEDHLTLDAPETWEQGSLELCARGEDTFVTLDGEVRVRFVRDARGSIVGAALSRGEVQTLAAARSTQRSIVTIEDPVSPTLAYPRAIVTIYDVVTSPASPSTVAYAN
jgi:hypothetical protein